MVWSFFVEPSGVHFLESISRTGFLSLPPCLVKDFWSLFVQVCLLVLLLEISGV